MGILNVTPDSFSDGGEHLRRDAAVAHGLRLHGEGADLVDVGGESTRPGAERAAVAVELDRVVPVVAALAAAGARVSVDTMRAEVAAAAVAAGAVLVNDVSGGLADPEMLATVAGLGVGYVAMHWRGHSDVMARLAGYDDVVAEVVAELAARRDAALAAGIAPERLVLDPGLGFAKTAAHNWALLARLEEVSALGHPVLVGASRKRFLGELLATGAGQRPPRQRDAATAALTALLASHRIWGVRTHTVAEQRDAIAVAERLLAEREPRRGTVG
ncbi:MAG: dihydropteroate synthase [Propionicimonas sp.]|nr:dihydropteroate synthase [Propionicimonas sp.]